MKNYIIYNMQIKNLFRDVAQFGSAPVLGTGGRRFESCHPDFFIINIYLVFINIIIFIKTKMKIFYFYY